MVREIIWVEKYQVSSLCLAAVVCYQGRQPYMEDRFSVITNINNSEVSLYAVFDGHAGNFASDFAAEIILPSIGDKISDVLNITRIRADKLKKEKEKEKEAKKKKGKPNQEIPVEQEVEKNEELETPTEPDPLEEYITPENLVNYEKLLFDEIMMFDKLLIERMIKATLFCGSTANIVLVDLTNKLVICANVGDSRAVLCDSKGNAVALSHDHKPDNPEELERIRASGGYISNKNGCWSKQIFLYWKMK